MGRPVPLRPISSASWHGVPLDRGTILLLPTKNPKNNKDSRGNGGEGLAMARRYVRVVGKRRFDGQCPRCAEGEREAKWGDRPYCRRHWLAWSWEQRRRTGRVGKGRDGGEPTVCPRCRIAPKLRHGYCGPCQTERKRVWQRGTTVGLFRRAARVVAPEVAAEACGAPSLAWLREGSG